MATKGAPSAKNITATDKSETIRYSRACTALLLPMTSTVEMTATADEI
jgi:hypothetical protein